MFNFFRKKSKSPEELFFHTEVHCHLAPGIDDGQRNAEDAAALVARERGWGIERIFCTPHITQDTFENTPQTISDAFDKLKTAVESVGVDVRLDYSAEHRLDSYFLEELEAGHIKPFPNNYLLVENSYVQEAWDLDQMLFDLKVRGFKPILAHPERYSYYFDKRDRYKQLHSAGTLFQVNLLSLAGHYGKEVKRVAEELLEKGMIDFLGSDMHNRNHCEAIEAYLASRDYHRHAQALKGVIKNDIAFD